MSRWETLEFFRCPACGGIELQREEHSGVSIRCATCSACYREEDGILDFVPPDISPGNGSIGDASEAHYWEEEEEIYRPFDHEVPLGFARQRTEFIRRLVPLDEVESAADVGSGNGMSTHCLEPYIDTIFSIDFSKHLLSDNPAQLRLRGDAYRLPFRDKSVDLVYSWELLHHVEQPRTVLMEMNRVAKKFVFFFEPNRWNPAQTAFALASKPNRKALRNTYRFFLREIERAGLSVVDHQIVGWLTPNVPPVWVYRILRRLPFRVPFVGLSHFFLLRCPQQRYGGGRPGDV